jgi:hypothetical protein
LISDFALFFCIVKDTLKMMPLTNLPAFNFAHHHTINHALPPNTPLTPFCVGPTVTKARTQLSDSLMAIRWLCLSNVQW